MLTAQRLVDTLERLTRHGSPQSDLQAVRSLIADEVIPLLPEGFFDSVRLDDDGNLVAERRSRSGATALLVCGYSATFPGGAPEVQWISDGASGGARLRGRGLSEQLAPLAAAIEGLHLVLESGDPLPAGIRFVVTTSGEMGSHTVVERMAAAGSLEAEHVVLAYGTDNHVCLGNMGRADVHVVVGGRSGHSSNPRAAVNAIEGGVAALQRLVDVPLPDDPDLGPATLAVTHFESSPKAMHTIPNRVDIILDQRLVPGDDVGEAVDKIRSAIGPLPPFEVEVTVGRYNYPSKVAVDAPVAAALIDALEQVTGASRVRYLRATLDAGFFTRAGRPAVMFGPGDPGLAHTESEDVALDDVLVGARVFAAAYRRLAS